METQNVNNMQSENLHSVQKCISSFCNWVKFLEDLMIIQHQLKYMYEISHTVIK